MKRIETIAERQMQVAEVDSPNLREDQVLLKTKATSVLMENVGLGIALGVAISAAVGAAMAGERGVSAV